MAAVASVGKLGGEPLAEDLRRSLPLYAASLMVTLAGVGAVGVTIDSANWGPLWALVTVVGHVISILLRSRGVPTQALVYPVMLLGPTIAMQLAVLGHPLSGLDTGIAPLPIDGATAVIVGMIAAIRSFTLLSNSALLFAPVPAITMLALVGSSNPNAEVPIFFGLLILGSLFITGYETSLRRAAASGREPAAPIMHLLVAWATTLLVMGAALLFPVVVQPLIGPLSPFALPAVTQLQQLMNFTQARSNQVPVGRGPVRLTEAPVYEMYSPTGGLVRTRVFSDYTGRGWQSLREASVDLHSYDHVEVASTRNPRRRTRNEYLFTVPQEPVYPPEVPVERLQQRFVTVGSGPDGVPGLGRIVGLRSPRQTVYLHGTGIITGGGTLPGSSFSVTSEVPSFPPDLLRAEPAVNPTAFDQPETLALPNSTLPVRSLAREITLHATTPYDRVQAVIDYLNANTRYTLDAEPTPQGTDAVVHYLFRSKKGACDLAASAAAMMCRSVGVPARVAVGFLAEEVLPQGGGYLLRQSHSHMWLEVYFPKYGWVPFNPSPALLDIRENPVVMLWNRARDAIGAIGGGGLDALLLVGVVLLTLGALAGYGVKALRRKLRERARRARLAAGSPGAAVALVYLETVEWLQRRGWQREGGMTPREYCRELEARWTEAPPAAASMATLTDCFERAHYAGDVTAENLAKARMAAAELRLAAPRPPKPARAPAALAEAPA